ncbi:MAG: OmpA family protein [Robiginitalea sp.]
MMKNSFHIFWILVLISFSNPVLSQADLAGTYGLASQVEGPELGQDRAASEDNLQGELLSKKASEYGIPLRTYSQLEGVESGYYMIVGVFRETTNLPRLIRELKGKGLSAGSFRNPENQLNYVYANRYINGGEALNDARSQLGGKYLEKVWILGVEGNPEPKMMPVEKAEPVAIQSASSPGASDQSLVRPNDPPTSEDVPEVRPVQVKKSDESTSKLLKKANSYFDRMWYAEAAELYETALLRNPEQKSLAIIEKVADAHYFNANMDRAYYWYDALYEVQKKDMASENLFKYAHALKGAGKYRRARRLLRIYDKKMAEELSEAKDPVSQDLREQVLDNILMAEDAFIVRNLEINSKYSDFGPMFYGDNRIVFASASDSSFFSTRRYKWNNQPFLDLYVASMNEGSNELHSAVKFSKKINTKYHEAAVTFSPDQQTMYFTRNNYGKKLNRDINGVNHLKIYRSRKVGGSWTEAEELPFNGEDYSTGHPALSPDGSKLFFVSDMPGSLGETDIFYVDINADGSFSMPKNLGANINTKHKEMFPFVSEGKLYFSSNGHIGLGGLDVYESVFDPESGFLPAKNVGKPVNSKSDDFSFIIREDTHSGYFASNRRGGKGDDDLYSFDRLLPEEVNENAIAGVVIDLISGEVLPEAMVSLLDENQIKLKEMTSSADGSFVFEELGGNTRYHIRTVKEGYQEENREVQTLKNELVSTEIAMNRLEERIVMEEGIRKLKIDKILFDFDKFTIRNDAASELDELAAMMKQYPSMVIKIESHTDSRGSDAYNKYLSDKRAKSTRDYLIRQGIAPSRIESAVGYGEERLLNDCDGSVQCSSGEHQRNRRSEFIIVNM